MNSPLQNGRSTTRLPSAQEILERIDDGIVAFDSQMNCTFVNKKGSELLGRNPEELIGKNYWLEYPEATGTPFADACSKAMENQQVTFVEEYYQPWDRWFERRIFPSNTGLTIFFTDITERKRAEEALHERQRQLSTLINNFPGTVYRCRNNKDYTAEFVSEKVAELTGYPASDFNEHRRHLGDMIHPDDQEWVWSGVQKALGKKQPYELTYRFRDANSREKWVWEKGLGIFDEKGELEALEGFVLDITEGKRAEAQVKQTLEWQEAVFEGSRDAVFISDSESRFVSVNKAACGLTGFTRQELLTMRIPDLHEEPDLKAYHDTHERIMHGEEILSEAKVRRKDGSKVDTEFNNKRIVISGVAYIHTTARDITERKQVEEEIKSLAKFPSENPNPIMRITRDGTLLYMNEAGVSLLGDWHLQVGKEAPPMLREAAFRSMRDGTTQMLDLKYGELMYAFYVAPVVDSGYANLYGRNITRRKRVEELLRASEKKYRELVDNLSDVIYEINSMAEIVFVNPAVRNVLGYEPEELVGKSAVELVHDADRDFLLKRLGELKQGIEYPVEYRMKSKSGDIRWVRTWSKPIREGNTFLGARGTLVDITEQKRVEGALRQSQQRYRQLFESISDAVMVYSSRGEFLDCNDATLQRLGYSRAELLSSKAADIVHSDYHSVMANNQERIWAGEKTLLESAHRCKDGKVIPVEVNAQRIEYQGEPAILAVVRDITERKRAEEELVRNTKQLRSLMARLQSVREEEQIRIARDIHDNLGQALTGLKMDVTWLQKKQITPATKKRTKSIISLIDGTIKTVRKIAAEIRPSVLDQLGLIPALEWQAQEFQKRTGIDCRFKADVKQLRFKKNQTTELFRIVQEALTNVAQHAKARKTEIHLVKRNEVLTLAVRDDGKGITENELQGTKALGLLGMKERVSLLHGTLKISGTKGKGTTVTVRVPLPRPLKRP